MKAANLRSSNTLVVENMATNTHKLSSFHLSNRAVACSQCSLSELCLPEGLSQQQMVLLEAALEKPQKIKKKSYLFRQDDSDTCIYAVKSGAIKSSLSTPDGEEQILGFYLPGDILGFDALARGQHTCDAQAIDDSLICQIDLETYRALTEQAPNIQNQFMRKVGTEIERSQTRLLTLGQMRTEERLATFLSSLSTRNRAHGFSAVEFYLPMSRGDLANYLGMAVETLSRMFARLQDDEVVEVQHRNIKILDAERLSQLSHHSCSLA